MDGYIICTTSRSGSTLLCDLLTATGVAGRPDSFFMADPAPCWLRTWGLPSHPEAGDPAQARAFLDAVRRAGRGDTGVFGLRLMQGDLAAMMRVILGACGPRETDAEGLRAAFGRFRLIHLRRQDLLAQAISHVKAEQTGLWHVAPDGREIERLSPPALPRYDFDRIHARIADITAQNAAWEAWFAQEGLCALRLDYESVRADPAQAVTTVCASLNISLPQNLTLAPETAKLADDISADWARRYREELPNRGSCQA
jgi:LPS sulfotransferase NodH